MEERSASNRVIEPMVLLAHLGKKWQEAWRRGWLAEYPEAQPSNRLGHMPPSPVLGPETAFTCRRLRLERKKIGYDRRTGRRLHYRLMEEESERVFAEGEYYPLHQ